MVITLQSVTADIFDDAAYDVASPSVDLLSRVPDRERLGGPDQGSDGLLPGMTSSAHIYELATGLAGRGSAERQRPSPCTTTNSNGAGVSDGFSSRLRGGRI